MAPNIGDGQILYGEKVALSDLNRGDIIFYKLDNGSYLKRLIGLPGESIEIHDGKVFINGKVLEETYKPYVATYVQPLIKLGKDDYYVLGDNRNYSSDSHVYGPISGADIVGRVIP